MVPRHKWYILRRRDIDIYIYTTNHHCMYPHIVSMLIHRMIMLTTTYYVPTTSPSSSATMQLTLGKKNKTHKKKYSQEAAGAFRHQHHHHTLCLWSVATSFCQKATAGTKQSGVLVAPIWRIPKGMDGSAYACLSHHNPAGEIENFHHIQFFNRIHECYQDRKGEVNIYNSEHDPAIFCILTELQ